MNTKILLKSLKFSLLPTLITFTLLLLGFMSFENALAFLTAQTFWSITVRILLFVAEIALISFMYRKYMIEEVQLQGFEQAKRIYANPKDCIKDTRHISYTDYIRDIKPEWRNSTNFVKSYTEDPNIVIITKID